MTADLHKMFLQATGSVLQLMLDLGEISHHPVECLMKEDQLNVSIGIRGDLTGRITYYFPHSTSLDMVKIMSGMNIEEVDDFVISAIAEIANIISGNVLTMLTDSDLRCDITPPMPHEFNDKKDHTLRTLNCINTSIGDVCLDIKLNPSRP